MDNNILIEVIEVEREIQKCLEIEQAKARDWLEKVKKECAEEVLKEEARISVSRAAAEDLARKEADESTASSVRAAAALVEHMDRLDRAVLQVVVDKHIRTILPLPG
jgi:CRISPR/Cas system-associated protein Csm6